MRYLSVCSGIEAASAAWGPIGMEPAGFSEIETFPCSVLAYRFPNVRNYGDMTRFEEWDINGTIDILVGGTPCQSFSVAGLRGGLEDDRGNLALTYCRILQKFRPRWFVWENVPGVLSSNGGRDFGSILGAMEELGYGIAYRVLDAQYFGVPQRRRRVFVVGCAGDWRRAAEVLFEPGCLRGDSEKGGKKRKDITGSLASRTSAGGGLGTDFDIDGGLVPTTQFGPIAGTLTRRHDSSPCHDRGQNIVAYQLEARSQVQAVAFAENSRSEIRLEGGDGQRTGVLSSGGGKPGQGCPTIASKIGVRRLTPRECERLQGFPDDWTLVPHRNKLAADGPRYKAIGNSMAVPVMRWIGERILLKGKKSL